MSATPPIGALRVQLSGYEIWAELRGDGWYVVDRDSNVLSGPWPSERSAIWHATAMTDTSGT